MKADDGAAVEVRFTDYTCAQCRSGSLTLASLDHALPKNPQCPPSIRSPREAEGNMRPSLFRRRKMIARDILRQGTCINAPGTSLIGERSSQIAQNRARTIYHCPNRDLKRDLFYEIFHARAFYIVNSSSGSRSFGVCSRDCKLYLMSVSRIFGDILHLVISLVQLD